MKRALKWLGAGVGLVLVLIAAVIVSGFALPGDLAYETTREIDATPEELFPYLDSQEGLTKWWGAGTPEAEARGYPPMELVSLPGPASGGGMRFEFRAGASTMEIWEVLASEPPRRVVYDVDFQILRVERTITVDLVDADTTLVRWAEKGHTNNPLVRWMAFLQGDGIVENFQMALGALETQAEAP